ncbi:hypothetical protein ABEB36_012573 [Hypothenemus hampei]|uniref:THAP-type domain-containing protein n=1 Tax=Hypothenemus hampei TaxID=57062 RepID=A0ABD1EBQ4_HYPHA
MSCAVKGCKNTDKDSAMHDFPSDPEIFSQWVKACARDDICYETRHNCRVCVLHFSEDMRLNVADKEQGLLKPNAVPNIHLSIDSVADDTDSPIKGNETIISENSSTSAVTGPSQLYNNVSHNAIPPNTRKTEQQSIHRYPVSRLIVRRKLGSRTSHNRGMPFIKRCYSFIRYLFEVAERLNKENARVEWRLNEASDFSRTLAELLNKVNKSTYKMLLSKIQLQDALHLKRRFTLEEKLSVLTLFNESPKTYRVLSKIFGLPSNATLLNLLNKVPFAAGINKPILNSLRHPVRYPSKIHKYCTLLFDEIPLKKSEV